MAHGTNIISSIKLPGGAQYEIHDAQAIHSVEELGLSSALVFKGVKKTEAEVLAITNAKVGDVWLVDADENAADGVNAIQVEYVCVTAISGTANANAWEKLGNIHDAASSSHIHDVNVTGTNTASTVTGTVTIPTVSKTQKYLSASIGAPSVTKPTDTVLGTGTTFTVDGGDPTTTKVKASASGTAVGANGTAAAITGFGAHSTDAALGTGATFKVSGGTATTNKMVTTKVNNPTVTDVTIPNVTANSSVTASKVKTAGSNGTKGTAASWTATVTNGVLSFDWTANTPTVPSTIPTFDSVTATNTTLGTALSASSVSTAEVTVATGTLSSTGGGQSVVTSVSTPSVAVNNADAVTAITALGEATTANVLTGVKVTAQPSVTLSTGTTGDITVVTDVSDVGINVTPEEVSAVTNVTVGAPSITLTNNATSVTGSVPVVSAVEIGTAAANLTNGQAAAQTWKQSTGSTGTPK